MKMEIDLYCSNCKDGLHIDGVWKHGHAAWVAKIRPCENCESPLMQYDPNAKTASKVKAVSMTGVDPKTISELIKNSKQKTNELMETLFNILSIEGSSVDKGLNISTIDFLAMMIKLHGIEDQLMQVEKVCKGVGQKDDKSIGPVDLVFTEYEAIKP